MLQRTPANQKNGLRHMIQTFDPEVPAYFFWLAMLALLFFQQGVFHVRASLNDEDGATASCAARYNYQKPGTDHDALKFLDGQTVLLGPLENGGTAHESVGDCSLCKRFAHPVFVSHVAVRAGHFNIRMPSFDERAYVCRDPGQDRFLRDRAQDVQGLIPVALQLFRNRSVHLDLLPA